MKQIICFVLLFFCLSKGCIAKCDSINPIQFGLNEAKTDVDRYWVLYKTHLEAKNNNSCVSYNGIDTVKIEIPIDAQTIPLTDYTDFCNAVILVKGQEKNFYLFSMSNIAEKYDISYKDIEIRKRIKDKDLSLIIIEDLEPWVKKREGFDYGHIRKDIVFSNNGRIEGSVISSYGTKNSKPVFYKCNINKGTKFIKNLEVIRDSSSTYKTFVLLVDNQYNVVIDNVKINTPSNDLFGDVAISLNNCYKIKIKDVIINGTYSQLNTYGYGISLNNVSDVTISGLKAKADWGIFGNKNVKNVKLKYCEINRFDVHCYGRDISFRKCTFRDLYNQFSSIFGSITFIDCEFIDFTPVLFESSYNAYTKFNLFFKNCVIQASRKRSYLISGGDITGEKKIVREELQKHEYPDLYINGLDIKVPSGLDQYYIYMINRRMIQWPKDSIPGIKQMKNIKMEPQKKLVESNLESLIDLPPKQKYYILGGCGMAMAICACGYYLRNSNRIS